MKRLFLFIVFTSFLTLSAKIIYSDEITVYFVGEVVLAEDPFCQCLGDVVVGSLVPGYYIYESTTVYSDPDPHKGLYQHTTTPYGFYLSVEDLEFKDDPSDIDFTITLHDSTIDENGLHDSFLTFSNNVVEINRDIPTFWMSFYLRDNSESALTSDSLLTEIPNLEDWPDSSWWHIIILGDGVEIRIKVTSLTSNPIPTLSNPGLIIVTTILIIFGCILILHMHKRRLPH